MKILLQLTFKGRRIAMKVVAWMKRVLKQSVTSTATLRLPMSAANSEVNELAENVFARLTRYDEQHARQDPQGLLFGIAKKVVQETGQHHEPITQEQWQIACERMRVALLAMPEHHVETLMLHVTQGLTYKQIAQQCGITDEVVIRRLTKAYAALGEACRDSF
jgi:RNA polymerase sigma factor (sigma-70 family)